MAPNFLSYFDSDFGAKDIAYDEVDGWNNDAKVIIFDEDPSGDLLTFLQANATPIVE